MKGKAVMIQGTGSSVGKSVLVTALCRILLQDGFKVAPFKAQNMTSNSYFTAEGLEIGMSQAAQAKAAGVEAESVMNPVLLKPGADNTAQVVLLGKTVGHDKAGKSRDNYLNSVLPVVQKSLHDLLNRFEVVVIEGAGSPAEVNLKDRDVSNMKVAAMVDAPVLMIGDIDKGGVLASLVGTMELLDPEERKRVAGFIINKFRGDRALLQPGLDFLSARTSRPVVGVIPYFHERLVVEEDQFEVSELPDSREQEEKYNSLAAIVRENIDMSFIRHLLAGGV